MIPPENGAAPGGRPEGCNCSSICSTCDCDPTAKQLQIQVPTISTAEAHFLRGYRDRWQHYHDQTGERRALAVVESLTFALVEGGRLP